MSLEPQVVKQIQIVFAPLHDQAGAKSLPEISALSLKLESHFANASLSTAATPSANITPGEMALFATAAVEMWQRAVHSYLISASLTDASPIWSCVSGYYSSHYSVRALAHLLGCFHLHSKRRVVKLQTTAKRPVCIFEKKTGDDREHKAYWKFVKENPAFKGDPLFTINPSETEPSDVAHRDRANYADHIGSFPTFRPLNESDLRVRTRRIAQMTFDAPPIPRRSRYPDVDSVQIVAYHRLIKFRSTLDTVLSANNRFWNGNRNPAWASLLDFQLAQQGGITSLGN